jgi:magnesium transporter
MAETFLYLTELLGLRVFDLRGHAIGRIKEAALVPLISPNRVDRFLIGADGSWLSISHDQIGSISLDGVQLASEVLTPFHSDEYLLRLVRDLLDQQIIDAQGRKVVRVTDVTFEVRENNGLASLHVTEVDIGVRSVLRRLFQGAMPRRWIRWIQQPIAPKSIPWQFCNIIEPDPMRRLRLNISPSQLEKMHPADLADIVEELGPDAREAVIRSIDVEAAADTLSEVDRDVQASILESLESEEAAKILEEMHPDEAADLLQELEEERSEEILEEMSDDPKEEVEELLEYGEHTAGGLMNVEYVAGDGSTTVESMLSTLRSTPDLPAEISHIFVVDQSERLLGQIPLLKLMIAPPSTPLSELAEPGESVHLHVTAKERAVVEAFDKYNLLSLAVTDDEQKLVGVITADDVIATLARRD